jgi:hypothetical protein
MNLHPRPRRHLSVPILRRHPSHSGQSDGENICTVHLHQVYKVNYGKATSLRPNVIWPGLLKAGFEGMWFVTLQLDPTKCEAQIERYWLF